MPSDEIPWLSVVVPLKNEAENVAFVTEGILAACGPLAPFELVYVDDGSTDATAAGVLSLAARHPEVRLVQHADERRAVGGDPQRRARRPRPGDLHARRRRPEPAVRDREARRQARGPALPRRRRADRRPAGRAAGHRLEAARLQGRQRPARAAPEGRHPRHRLRAEALPPRRLPGAPLLRPHAPLPAGARRPRRLADAARRRRATRRGTPAARTTPTSAGRWSASTTSSGSCG